MSPRSPLTSPRILGLGVVAVILWGALLLAFIDLDKLMALRVG